MQIKMSAEINIALGFDARFAPHAAATIASIANSTKLSDCRFIILHTGVGEHLKTLVESASQNSRFDWVEVNDDDIPAFEARRHLTRATLFRLGLEHLAPRDCNRVIYLDVDLIVTGDLTALWNCDLEGHPIGAVADGLVNQDNFFARQWGISADTLYFNAGVLLIDLEQIREKKHFTATMEFVAKHDKDLPFNDQDALNKIFLNNWHPLNVAWNVQRPQAVPWDATTIPAHLQLGDQRPLIIHYTGPEKPWLADGYHPWSWLYWQNLSYTPFFHSVARAHGVGRLHRLRLYVRWLKRRPRN